MLCSRFLVGFGCGVPSQSGRNGVLARVLDSTTATMTAGDKGTVAHMCAGRGDQQCWAVVLQHDPAVCTRLDGCVLVMIVITHSNRFFLWLFLRTQIRSHASGCRGVDRCTRRVCQAGMRI